MQEEQKRLEASPIPASEPRYYAELVDEDRGFYETLGPVSTHGAALSMLEESEHLICDGCSLEWDGKTDYPEGLCSRRIHPYREGVYGQVCVLPVETVEKTKAGVAGESVSAMIYLPVTGTWCKSAFESLKKGMLFYLVSEDTGSPVNQRVMAVALSDSFVVDGVPRVNCQDILGLAKALL